VSTCDVFQPSAFTRVSARRFITGIPMIVELNAVRNTPASREPYPHLIVPGFLSETNAARVIADYPKLDVGGVYLPDAAPCGEATAQLLADLGGEKVRDLVAEKLGVDLSGRPALVTMRSRCRMRDGRIHSDSSYKLATLLLYLNEPWDPPGGRLRILRSNQDIEDYAAEVPPDAGTLVCFKVQPNSWHGHKPFSGRRRCVMVNYCADEAVRDAEANRHRHSMRWKKLLSNFSMGAGDEQAA
jgi:SM-20-related protein